MLEKPVVFDQSSFNLSILRGKFEGDINSDRKITRVSAPRQRTGVNGHFKGPLSTPLEPLHRKLCLGNFGSYVCYFIGLGPLLLSTRGGAIGMGAEGVCCT